MGSKPYLRSHTLSFAGTETGKSFRVKLRAINAIGYAESSLISFVLAAVPDQPAAGPVYDAAGSTGTSIKVTYTAPASNGGTDITSYELQMDDGLGGDFVSLVGLNTNNLKLFHT